MKSLFVLMISLFTILSACSNDLSDVEENEQQDLSGESDSEEEKVDEEEDQEASAPINGDEEKSDDTDRKHDISLPDEVVNIDSQGEDVETIQEALQLIGYDFPDEGTAITETSQAIIHFQELHEELDNDGVYGPDTGELLNDYVVSGEVIDTEGYSEIELPGFGNDYPPQGKPVEDPDDILVLVNKENYLPAGYTPADLVEPDVPFPFEEDLPQRLMRAEAADALESLFESSQSEGLELFAQSGFRSAERQEAIFASNVDQDGLEQANEYSARAGESEHQTGLAMDVTSQEVNFRLNTDFADTAEGQWLDEHAAEYGFIIRYQKGKEDITGYQYEPWHIRYVGKEAAKEITENNLTLEEYLEE
ncbi:D-alanyl-D-alanine carboxypeptidase family protein [Texcoconibacillus texcoconensis]|uniref:D-alanyl-D-alanine carboxypeptidase n=1 Tax=Texcoconibacillus texcoconensis TaxID=1095777 RepID=A0A840QSY7_9BACI|nr:D-alanyl-D-alanine carboxypeptidase family protein [Texcoconibacillus texcoconensis]MBB5174646.1 D-alanyl-D-alanine carboxypeptidase [Texcoconibacillus texcoconensis]